MRGTYSGNVHNGVCYRAIEDRPFDQLDRNPLAVKDGDTNIWILAWIDFTKVDLAIFFANKPHEVCPTRSHLEKFLIQILSAKLDKGRELFLTERDSRARAMAGFWISQVTPRAGQIDADGPIARLWNDFGLFTPEDPLYTTWIWRKALQEPVPCPTRYHCYSRVTKCILHEKPFIGINFQISFVFC
jgi:hypothetical protein